LAFTEDHGIPRVLCAGLNVVESLQGLSGKIAEEAIRPRETFEAAVLDCALHTVFLKP
jgi:hypothetical protein